MTKLKTILIIVVLIIIAFLIVAYFTGRKSRSYNIFPFNTQIKIGENQVSTLEFANTYHPKLFSNPKNPTQPILWTWYEIIETDNSYDIVYYHCWENEVNPKKSFDVVYKIFRSVYFGYPLYDIEYVLVKVNKTSFKVENITFETSINSNYNQEIVMHYVNSISRKDENSFIDLVSDKSGNDIESSTILLDKTESKIHLGIQTWNHMLCPISNTNRMFYSSIQNTGKLKQLTNTDYKAYKFSRKSQSKYKTESKPLILVLLTIGISSLLVYLFYGRPNKTTN